MSGIVGLFDPGGVDLPSVERAVQKGPSSGGSASFREIDRWIVGALGEGGIVATADRVCVSDARVDAILDPALGHRISRDDLDPLGEVLSSHGPAGLSGVAGDFAIGHIDRSTGTLTLARDAFGLRPLYWAVRDGRWGFASDVEALIGFGLADGSVDGDAVRSLLFERGEYGERTVYAGVRRVVSGRWVQISARGEVRRGRWFHPEQTRPDGTMTLAEAGERTKNAAVSAVADRARGGRVALFLSAGRDSSAVAVALAEAGIKATCLTYEFDLPSVYSEAPGARELARSLGHDWRQVPVQVGVPPARASELARLVGKPVNGVGGPIQLAMYDAVRALEPDVVMSGEGGDLLFSAFPIGILDLMLRGRMRAAMQAARAFDREWTYGYPFVAKVLLRGLAPRAVLAMRERRRQRAPWLIPPGRVRVRSDRTDAGYLRHLMVEGSDATEAPQRLFQAAGATMAWPLVDLRVVDVALRFPVELRLPYPAPKQVLDEALLGERGRGLVKASLADYIGTLLPVYRAHFRAAYGEGSLGVQQGLVRPVGSAATGETRWSWESADLAGLEMWLRWLEEQDER